LGKVNASARRVKCLTRQSAIALKLQGVRRRRCPRIHRQRQPCTAPRRPRAAQSLALETLRVIQMAGPSG
jgi:hypothetical protein